MCFRLSIYQGSVVVDLPDSKMEVPKNNDRCTSSDSTTSMSRGANELKVTIAGAGQRKRSMQYVDLTDKKFDFTCKCQV